MKTKAYKNTDHPTQEIQQSRHTPLQHLSYIKTVIQTYTKRVRVCVPVISDWWLLLPDIDVCGLNPSTISVFTYTLQQRICSSLLCLMYNIYVRSPDAKLLTVFCYCNKSVQMSAVRRMKYKCIWTENPSVCVAFTIVLLPDVQQLPHSTYYC